MKKEKDGAESGYGYGYKEGNGCGDGHGSGYGHSYNYYDGCGSGCGGGDGHGSGYGYDYKNGSGYGYGYGYGDSYGYGSGYGYEEGNGDGSDKGYGYGYGYGHGDSYGSIRNHGSENEYGSGSGYEGEIEIFLDKSQAWIAYHFIEKRNGGLYLRGGRKVELEEEIWEEEIELCTKGLHASLCQEDAEKYKPSSPILTEVLVWGKVIVGDDKIVSQYRKIIKKLEKKENE